MGSYLCVMCEKTMTDNPSIVCNSCDDIMFKKGMKFYEEYDNNSIYMEERLYESDPLDNDIDRNPSIKNTKKSLDEYEEYIDKMSFFIENKKLMEDDFISRLENEIGRDKAVYFCDLIRNYWYDGSKRKSSKKIKELKHSINKYLGTYSFVIDNEIEKNIQQSLITHEDIGKILDINAELFNLYLEDWIDKHPFSYEKNTSNIFFLRGLNLDSKLIEPYKEKDYINSYTLSLSMAEQFSDMGNDENVIVSGEYGLFYKRILFFSPFIPKPDLAKLKKFKFTSSSKSLTLQDFDYHRIELCKKIYPEQLEIGIIPHVFKINFEEKEYLGGVRGYKLYD